MKRKLIETLDDALQLVNPHLRYHKLPPEIRPAFQELVGRHNINSDGSPNFSAEVLSQVTGFHHIAAFDEGDQTQVTIKPKIGLAIERGRFREQNLDSNFIHIPVTELEEVIQKPRKRRFGLF